MIEKLKLYKTAFSPMYNTYVGIISVHLDGEGQHFGTNSKDEPVIVAHRAGHPDERLLFRVNELENFVL